MKIDGFYILAGGVQLDIELTNYVEGEEPTITADPYDSDPGSAPEAEFNLYCNGVKVDPYYIFDGAERLDEAVHDKIVEAHEGGFNLEFGDLSEAIDMPEGAMDFDLEGIPAKLVILNKPEFDDRYDMDFQLLSLDGCPIDVESISVKVGNEVEELHTYIVDKVYSREEPSPDSPSEGRSNRARFRR